MAFHPRGAILAAAILATTQAASPIPGFRPPAVPLFTQSPEINVWSYANTLNEKAPVFWTGADVPFFAGVLVDTTPYLLMGSPSQSWSGSALNRARQTSVAVYATQTRYTFVAGAVALNLTFTSPLITSDWELLSRPAHYVTFAVASTDGAQHTVSTYFDITGDVVVRDNSVDVSWSRIGLSGGVTALRIGATTQKPLQDTNDRPSWGIAYLVANAGAGTSTVLEYSNTTRSLWWAQGTLPAADNTKQPAALRPPGPMLPPTGPQAGIDRSGNDLDGYPVQLPSADPNLCWAKCNQTAACHAWAYAVPGCDSVRGERESFFTW